MKLSYKITKDKTTDRLKENVYIISPTPNSEDDVYLNSNSSIPLTHIAETYYGSATLWKYIATVNNLQGMYAPDGIVLRIPLNSEISFVQD